MTNNYKKQKVLNKQVRLNILKQYKFLVFQMNTYRQFNLPIRAFVPSFAPHILDIVVVVMMKILAKVFNKLKLIIISKYNNIFQQYSMKVRMNCYFIDHLIWEIGLNTGGMKFTNIPKSITFCSSKTSFQSKHKMNFIN